jgi:NitT/TauT family transport system substrate-binding protein
MKIKLCAALFLVTLLNGQTVWCQAKLKLNINYPAISGVIAGLWVAAEANYFDKYGLDVKLIYIPTALQATRVIMSGDSPIGLSGGTPVVNAALGGAELIMVGGVANVPAFYIMALPEIKTVADLRGKTLGVTRFGSSTDFALRYLLQKQGMNPDKDVNILQMGGMPELAAALSKKLIAAAPLSAPTHVRARSAGALPLVDLAKAGIYFPQTAVVTRRSFLKTNREIIVNFFKAYSEGTQRLINDKPLGKKIIQKYTHDNSDEIIEASWQYAVDYIARPPYIPREGIVETLKLSTVPEARKANPDQFIDNSVVKELDDAGFFRQIGMR